MNWSNSIPEQEGYYWFRPWLGSETQIVLIRDGLVWGMGSEVEYTVEFYEKHYLCGEWVGPLSCPNREEK